MKNSKGKFSVKFRGIRGSYPVCDKNFLEYGGNTSCVEVNVNNHVIILDAGTGIIKLGEELFGEYIMSDIEEDKREPICVSILLTHLHQDHIQGLPFFKPLFKNSSNVNLIGYSDYIDGLEADVADLLFKESFPIDYSEINANIDAFEITPNEVLVYNSQDIIPQIKKVISNEDLIPKDEEVIISSFKASSHLQNGTMIYKISYKDKSVVFATDKESFVGGDMKIATFARNTDLLIHDAQYTTQDYLNATSSKQGFGHSTFDMAIEAMKQSNAKQLAFFHMEPTYNDEILKNIENHYLNEYQNCFIARENQEIIIL